MKKLLLFIVATLTSMNLVKAQCDLNFDYVNTGTNMTAFFTPPAASAIHAELGDGVIGSFFTDSDGSLICAASSTFDGAQIQLAVMADDSTSPDKDGFSSGESINWFYQTADGSLFSINPSPNDNFTINGISFIESASISAIDCGGDDTTDGDQCPALDFSFVNTGSNMTLFITPPGASALATLGNGTIGVYYIDNDGQQLCGGASAFTGTQVQITAMADDSTSPEKDGFSAGEAIVWKFEDNGGNQYNLTPSPQDGFTLNGISFVSGISYDAISCAIDVEGCTDSDFVEYNSNATIDDGSCLTLIVVGCTDEFADNYNSNANVDDGSCFTSIPGCTDATACNYDSTANSDDGSCYNNDLGCGCDSPAAADGYDCEGDCLVDSDGDGVCDEFEIVGCQDPTAANYDPNATDSPSNGSDLCPPLNFDYVNTGSNMTLFVTDGSILSELGNGTIGVYFSDGGNLVCGGASAYTGSQVQIVVFGDDATTPEKDGFAAGESIVWKFEDTQGNQYNLNPGPNDVYALNAISFVTSMTYTSISCGGGDDIACEYLGCTNSSYLEYDSGATIDDGSCQTLIVEGCSDSDACNFDPSVNIEDNSCTYPVFGYDCDGNLWEDVYEDCVESGGDDGIGQSDVDAAYLIGYQNGVESVDVTLNDTQVYSDGFNAGVESVIPEDGVTQADVDAAVAVAVASAEEEITGLNESLTFYIAEASSLNDALANSESALNAANAQISELQAQIDDILANCGDDGITQIDVDAAYLIGYSDGAASVTPEDGIGQADVDAAYASGAASVECDPNAGYSIGYSDGAASVTPEDGIGQADVDAAYADGVASVTPEDGIGQADVDAAYADGVASVDITSDNSTIADESYLFGYNDGAASAQADIDALQVLLDEALANSGGGSCEPIYVDLLEGWNIIGYTLPNPQDVAATLASIVSNVQIVKNNSAAVYWPEYSFNGIGDFIPGQGYQIRMNNALNNYTFPDVGSQRIELTPTVPEWVHELPVLNHPNDIRSLVRVVNMLGQQVDPSTQFKGEILLYLYNDGTTEKRIVN